MLRAFSPKTKLEAFKRAGGRCSVCTAKLFPGNCEYDHGLAHGLGGNSDLDNCFPVCRACHRTKTAADLGKIARARRRERFHASIKRPRTICAWRRFDGSPVYAPRER